QKIVSISKIIVILDVSGNQCLCSLRNGLLGQRDSGPATDSYFFYSLSLSGKAHRFYIELARYNLQKLLLVKPFIAIKPDNAHPYIIRRTGYLHNLEGPVVQQAVLLKFSFEVVHIMLIHNGFIGMLAFIPAIYFVIVGFFCRIVV